MEEEGCGARTAETPVMAPDFNKRRRLSPMTSPLENQKYLPHHAVFLRAQPFRVQGTQRQCTTTQSLRRQHERNMKTCTSRRAALEQNGGSMSRSIRD